MSRPQICLPSGASSIIYTALPLRTYRPILSPLDWRRCSLLPSKPSPHQDPHVPSFEKNPSAPPVPPKEPKNQAQLFRGALTSTEQDHADTSLILDTILLLMQPEMESVFKALGSHCQPAPCVITPWSLFPVCCWRVLLPLPHVCSHRLAMAVALSVWPMRRRDDTGSLRLPTSISLPDSIFRSLC